MPSKQIYVKPYQVKGHWRTLHTRTFKFICAHCDQESQRTTYATTCPKYCDECKNLKQKLGKKKAPSGEIVVDTSSTSKDTQKQSTTPSLTPETPQKSSPSNKPDQTSTSTSPSTKSAKTAATAQTATQKTSNPPQSPTTNQTSSKNSSSNQAQTKNPPKSDRDIAAEVNLELDSNKLIEYTNQLFLIHYNKGLNSDSKHILIDLWSNKDYQEIESSRGIKTKAIRKITSNLFEHLSNVLGEKVHLRNLREVMNKHYRAYHSLSR
ncbi:MAG: hypothetical protein QNJ54_37800 [Prochloraceae cyanobacterium]|nr:hypothetical protein [Prochloraceae cyanobacterium]